MTPAWRALLPKLGADPAKPVDDSPVDSGDASKAAHGRWPLTKQGFVWDLVPDAVAPSQDGLVPPAFVDPPWVAQAAAALDADELGKLLAAEHERNLSFQASAATSEGKASRLLTPIVALLTADATLVAFELDTATSRHNWWSVIPYAGAALGAVAALLLITAALRAIDADTRVGMYLEADPIQNVRPSQAALSAEVRGTALARWTANGKSTRVMFARAALSRSLLLITLALGLGAATVITGRWASSSSDMTSGPHPVCQRVRGFSTVGPGAPVGPGRPGAFPLQLPRAPAPLGGAGAASPMARQTRLGRTSSLVR